MMSLKSALISFVFACLAFMPAFAHAEGFTPTPMVLIPADGGKPAFQMEKYTVSNAQYAEFLTWVEQHGDEDVRAASQPVPKDHTPRFWKPFIPKMFHESGFDKLLYYKEDTFHQPNDPVVGVDWYDAYAYAKWAHKRLPTEAEWERAAGGPKQSLWPWGNEWDFKKCNSGGYEWKGERDGYIYLAPVDSFPQGQSVYGVFNMAGNAAQWVDNGADDASVQKVVKGGGSDSYPTAVSVKARKTHEPEYRTFTIGFRCAADVEANVKKSGQGAAR